MMTRKKHSGGIPHPHNSFNNSMEHMTGYRVPGVGDIEKKEIGSRKTPRVP